MAKFWTAVIAIGLIVLFFIATSGGGSKSPAERCDEKHGYGASHCLEVAENDLKRAEYGSLEAAHEAEHEQQIEDEVEEVEEVLKSRQAEHVADQLEGLR